MRPFRLVPRPATAVGLTQPDVALGQDGVFTRSQARAEGFSDGQQRRLLRDGTWIAVAGPALRHRETPDGPWPRARAVALTKGLIVSHMSAGQLWGLSVPPGLTGTSRSSRRAHAVRAHRSALGEADTTWVHGLQVTTPERTLTDLLCTLSLEEAVVMAAEGFRSGFLKPADLVACSTRAFGRTGAARARTVATTCSGRPYSLLEWRFHQGVRRIGPGWRFNVPVRDRDCLIGVVDAVHQETGIIVELDGAAFHGRDRFQCDRTRDQRLIALGYVVIRVTWDDVAHRLDDVLERLRRTMRLRAGLAVSPDHRAGLSA